MSRPLSILRRKAPVLAALFGDRKGATAITLAFALTGIAGMAGLATEASNWYLTSRKMQSAADAAAYSAATALAAGESKTDFTNEAKYVAASAGYNFTSGTNGVTVAVNNPPASGSNTSDNRAVEVVISQPQTPLLSGLFLSSGPTIKARSVATASINGNGCVLALDRGNVVDATDTGGAALNLNNCAIYINSDDPTAALSMSGGASITAAGAYVVGGIQTNGGASLNTSGNTHTGVAPINDPYANVQIPSYSGCNYGTSSSSGYSLSSGSSATLNPVAGGIGVFCQGLNVNGGAHLTLNAGIYIINGGSFTVNGGATVTATSGVTIVLTGSGSNYATVTINGGANISITAPTTGPTAGLAFFQDRNAPATGSDTINGGASSSITGAIYFPNQLVNFSGGSSTGGSSCTQLIALKLSFSGGTRFSNNCSGVGTTAFGTSSAKMVE